MIQKKYFVAIMSLVFLFSIPIIASGQTVTIPQYYGDYSFYPNDTFIDSYFANQNFDSEGYLWVGKRGNGFNYGDTVSFIKFDLSLIPPGSTINSAVLNVMANSQSSYAVPGSPSNTIQVQSVDSSWSSGTATWNNKPAYGNYKGNSRNSGFWSMSYVGWDVTALVSQWISNSRANNGLALVKTAGEEWSYVNFWSANYPAKRYPYLTIDYTTAPPPSLNLISNSSFETDADSNGIPDKWVPVQFATGDGRSTDSAREGAYSLKIAGNNLKCKRVMQRINVSGSAGEVFTLSGYNKTIGASATGNVIGAIVYINNTDGTKTGYGMYFKKDTHDWTYRSRQITAVKAFGSIDLYLVYSMQTGTAYFDDFKLVKQ